MEEQKAAEPVVVEATPTNSAAATPAASDQNTDYMAIGSLVLGIINLCSWFIPLCGCPLSIAGIVLGYLGQKSSNYKTYAMIGIGLSVFALILTIINGAWGAYLATQYPDMYNLNNFR